ncbi:MAG: hypothetical protein ACFFFB_05930 [Candidatus Heimdallarchaeota archaeon]
MTHFKLMSGIDCGVDKSVCEKGYPDNCFNCLSKRFSEANILMDIYDVVEQQSEQKRREMLYKHIWRKYQDILTIRHIIIISKGGLPAFNMAVGDFPIDPTLIAGFIQANVAFSGEELTLIDKLNPEKNFYEFEYKNFHLLLRVGILCTPCLILDERASGNLRVLLSNFTDILEGDYEDELQEFNKTGDLKILNPVKSLVEKIFEVTMIYPLTLSTQIPPDIFENLTIIQKAVYETCKDLLKDQDYFFILNLIKATLKLLGVISNEEILWNIYQMLREDVIIWADLEFQRKELESKEEDIQKREHVIQKIMEIKDLDEIIFECQDMNEDIAMKKVKSLLKKGEIAEKDTAYQEALNEYQKALTYAKEFNMETMIDKISFKILEIVKLNKEVELKFALEQASKSEKRKDYVVALKYLFQIKENLSSQKKDDKQDKQLQRINSRIKKLQNYFITSKNN